MKTYEKYISLFIAVALFITLVLAVPVSRVEASGAFMVEIKVSALNVRTGPGIQHTRTDVLSRSTYVTLLSRQGEWLQVRLPWGKIGWVFGGNGYTAMHSIKGYIRTTASSLNVRTGPGINNTRIGQVPLGTTAPVLETRSGWHRIIFDTGRAGWVSGTYCRSTTAGLPATTVTVSRDAGRSSTSLLQGKTIVIDPGHGGHDPGAVGRSFNLTEKFVNLDTSLRLAKLLESAGARVILTRSTDVFITLGNRAAMANNAKADLFVSVHANAHSNRAIGGTETYYNTSYRSGDSQRLASVVQQELVRELKLRDIGVKTAGFYVIRHTTMPSILVELAFLSNAREEGLLNQAAFRQRSAEAILRGIHRYFQ